jgi:hypothetical protein
MTQPVPDKRPCRGATSGLVEGYTPPLVEGGRGGRVGDTPLAVPDTPAPLQG